MRVAISGGTGFLGRPLVARLAGAGHEVLLLTRHPDAHRPALPGGVRALAFDAERGASPGLLDGCQGVIHLAGEPILGRFTRAHKDRVMKSRVLGTQTLAQAACSAKTVRSFISASAIGYYGDRGDQALSETSPPGTDFLAQVCAAWEQAAGPAARCGIRQVAVRVGIVLHPQGGRLASQLLPFRLGLGGVLGSGRQYVSWIHREDVLGLLEHALLHATLEGPVNATAPQPVTEREFTQALSAQLHRPAWFKVPPGLLRLALGELTEGLLASQRVLPQKALASGYSFRFPQLNGALADLLPGPPAT